MKAIQLLDKEKIEIREVTTPEISDDEMLIRVKAASICGTDVRMYRNGYKNVSEENPLIIGHEFAGEIAALGKNVANYEVGQRVSVAPNFGCGVCNHCVSGNTHLCRDMKAFGVTMDGGFAEYVRVPEKAIRQGNVSRLGDEITFEAAALVEPLSCVYNGQKMLHLEPGADALIIGMGPIGLMHIMVLKLYGVGRIFVNDLSHERCMKAKELFPEVTVIEGDVLAGLKANGYEGVDVCIIAAPAAAAQTASLNYMNMNGKLLFFGGLPAGKENVLIDSNQIHYKQLTIQGCSKQSLSQYRLCAKLVDDGVIPLDKIMSASYCADDFMAAMDNAAKAIGLKHVITF